MRTLKMKKLTLAVKNFWNDEKGVTAIEYGLIAALIAVTIVISVTSVGTALNAVFVDIAAKLTAAL
jgi:pilus assembly protein Flp/PilA